MKVIDCPSCKRVLALKQAVSNVRIRCKDCGAVFVGSSREATAEEAAGRHHHGPPSAGPSRPAKPSGPRSPYESEAPAFLLQEPPSRPAAPRNHPSPSPATYPPAPQGGYPPEEPNPEEYAFKRKGVPTWAWLTLLALPVVLLFVGMIAYYYNRNPHEKLTNAQGEVVYEGKLSAEGKAELEEKIRKEDEKKQKRDIPLTPAGEAKFTAGVSVPLDAPGPGASAPNGGPAAPETPARDDKVNTGNLKAIETKGVPDEGLVVGDLWNHHDTVLLSADVTVDLFDAQNNRLGSASAKVGAVPPNASVPFSAAYSGVNTQAVARIEGLALPRMAGPNYIAWFPPLRSCEFDNSTKKITVTGQTKSPVAGALTNVMAHCTFYDADNAVVGFVDVPAGVNGESPAGEQVPFNVVFDTSTTDVLPQVVHHFVLRIVAKKAEEVP